MPPIALRLPNRSRDNAFSYLPDPSLNERDLQMMRAFADMTGHAIESDLKLRMDQQEKSERIRRVFEQDQLSLVFQPIFNLDSGRIVGVEALARFSGSPQRGPDRVSEGFGVSLSETTDLILRKRFLDTFSSVADGWLGHHHL